MALTYFINKKRSTCVITLKGNLTPDDVATLDACMKEVLTDAMAYRVLNLAGLADMDLGTSRPFTIFQQSLRESSQLFICGLNVKIQKTLKEHGLVRDPEVQTDLMTVLQVILQLESKKESG